jgi:hypothetical protein
MKNHLIFFCLLTIVCFYGCEKTKYDYFDKNSLYVFQQNDTLIYEGLLTNDTFLVKNVDYSFRVTDNIHYYQQLNIYLKALNVINNDTMWNEYWDILIGRDIVNPTSINYRNLYLEIGENDSVTSYTIGPYNISKVYKLDSDTIFFYRPRAIKTIYYSHNYGIIAYILTSNEKFELGEKYFANQGN